MNFCALWKTKVHLPQDAGSQSSAIGFPKFTQVGTFVCFKMHVFITPILLGGGWDKYCTNATGRASRPSPSKIGVMKTCILKQTNVPTCVNFGNPIALLCDPASCGRCTLVFHKAQKFIALRHPDISVALDIGGALNIKFDGGTANKKHQKFKNKFVDYTLNSHPSQTYTRANGVYTSKFRLKDTGKAPS
jgi:hypothetical protein